MGFYEWRLRISLAAAQGSSAAGRVVGRSRRPLASTRWTTVSRWSSGKLFGRLRRLCTTGPAIGCFGANAAGAERHPFGN
jgi:hypothetical protein